MLGDIPFPSPYGDCGSYQAAPFMDGVITPWILRFAGRILFFRFFLNFP